MSFYTSLSGLRGAQTDLSTISNNIANVGSYGFKRSRAEFGDIMPASSKTAGQGVRLKGIQQQFTQGGFEASARELDLAISGSGFFVTRNSLEGGPGGAFRKYDLDYWGNCIFQAVQWASSTSQSFGKPVLISGHPAHLVHLNTLRLPGVHFTQASEDKHHMYVHLVRGTKAHIRSIERQPTLHAVDTPDGALLCTVVVSAAR